MVVVHTVPSIVVLVPPLLDMIPAEENLRHDPHWHRSKMGVVWE